jgi:hypothetical protein
VGRYRVFCCGTFINVQILHVPSMCRLSSRTSIESLACSILVLNTFVSRHDENDRVSIAVVVFRGGASATHPRTRRRLGITVVQPVPVRSGPSPVRTFVLPDSIRTELYHEVADYESGHVELAGFGVLHRSIPRDCTVTRRYRYSASAARLAQRLLAHIRRLDTQTSPPTLYVPPSPTDGSVSLGKLTYVAESMLVGFGELTSCHVVGYSSETQYSNPWIHGGFPRESTRIGVDEGIGFSLSSRTRRTTHELLIFFSGLVGIREGHDRVVKTELIDNREVFGTSPRSIVDMLREPRFHIKTSDWGRARQLSE